MLLSSDSIAAKLTEKSRRHARDRSQHLLCPSCRVRTRLYALKDGRKKCAACGGKFSPRRKSEALRLKQCADALLCFALEFPAQQASEVTGYRYRLVAAYYDRFRHLLAAQNLVPGKIELMLSVRGCDRGVHGDAFCKRCKGRFRCKGMRKGDSPVFGVKLLEGGRAFIEPLEDDAEAFRFGAPFADADPATRRRYGGYAGFVCRGKFHRFSDNTPQRDGAEQLWAWMQERLRRHHGVRKKNAGLYLKELEWKYNNRLLSPESQALEIAELLPGDFTAQATG